MEWPKASTTKYLMQAFGVGLVLVLVLFPGGERPVWVTGLVRGFFGVLVYAWVIRDSEHFHFSSGQKYASVSAILPEIGVPIYLFRTRSLNGGLLALIRIAGFVMLVAVLAVSVGMLMKRGAASNSAVDRDVVTRSSFQR